MAFGNKSEYARCVYFWVKTKPSVGQGTYHLGVGSVVGIFSKSVYGVSSWDSAKSLY
jgi:hypothetical protein